jgi:hypothetical protein
VKVSTTWAMGVSVLALVVTGCSQPTTVERTPVACAPAAQPEATKTTAPVVTTAPDTNPMAIAGTETKSATSKEAPSRAKTAATSSKPLSVKRLVVATGVNHREPEGEATLFRQSEIDKLYAYVEVENDASSTETITVSFEPPDGRAPRGNITLDVGSSPRWRTWAYTKNALDVGSWTAVVKDASGRTLARQPFEIAL